MKWQHSAKTYLQQIAERIQESFWGSEMIFSCTFYCKAPHLVLLLFLCSWTPKYIATSSPSRRICVLHSYFNNCLELPQGHFLLHTKKSWIVSLLLFLFSFRPQSDGIRLLQSETREGWGNAENYEWRKTAENIACPAGPGEHFPDILFKLLPLKRWTHCWSLTVRPKTSTTESSTAVSCCSLEIWSGQGCMFSLLKIFLFPPPGCLPVTMTAWLTCLRNILTCKRRGPEMP